MSDSSVPPSKARLEELRDSGIVPYSPYTTAAIAALTCIVYFLTAPLPLQGCREAVDGGVVQGPGLTRCVSDSIAWVVALIGATVATTVVVGLLQTRFLFHWGNVSWRASKLRHQERPHPVLAAVAVVAIFLVVTAVLVSAFGPLANVALGMSVDWQGEVLAVLRGVFLILSVLLALSAVGGWFVERWRFMMRHRMTARAARSEQSYGDL